MRRPPAVIRWSAEARDALALSDALAFPQPPQHLGIQVAVQGEERHPIHLVPQDHGRPVVETTHVVPNAAHHRVQRG